MSHPLLLKDRFRRYCVRCGGGQGIDEVRKAWGKTSEAGAMYDVLNAFSSCTLAEVRLAPSPVIWWRPCLTHQHQG